MDANPSSCLCIIKAPRHSHVNSTTGVWLEEVAGWLDGQSRGSILWLQAVALPRRRWRPGAQVSSGTNKKIMEIIQAKVTQMELYSSRKERERGRGQKQQSSWKGGGVQECSRNEAPSQSEHLPLRLLFITFSAIRSEQYGKPGNKGKREDG